MFTPPSNLTRLNDAELYDSTQKSVRHERQATTWVIDHLREVERRRLHSKRGHPSLFEFCTRELGYCNASAQLRIDAMRLSREVPDVAEALGDGRLTLTTIGVVQKFVRAERTVRGVTMTAEQKRELLAQVAGKSRAEAEQTLAERSPETARHLFGAGRESARPMGHGQTELRIIADAALMDAIAVLRAKMPGGREPSLAEVFAFAATEALRGIEAREERLKKKDERTLERTHRGTSPGEVSDPASRPELTPPTEFPDAPTEFLVPETRHAPARHRRQAFRSDGHRCAYVSKITGKRCSATRGLQLEHRQPFALGGSHEPENLEVLCAEHNQLRAVEVFGERARRRAK